MSGGRWFRGSLRSHLNHRAAGAVAAALVIALVLVVVVLVRHHDGESCAPEDSVTGAAVPPPFVTGDHPARGDRRLAALVDAADGWGLGRVVGALGFDYGHFLTLAGLPQGLAAWTKDNPDVAFLDDTLAPRWGIAQDRGQHAWDLSADRWFQLRLPAHGPMQVTARRLDDGALRWCAVVGTAPTRYGDPLGTLPLDAGDVVVMGADPAGALLTRLRGSTGQPVWSRRIAVHADGTALLAFGTAVVVGGRASYDLGGHARDRLRAFDPRSGQPMWSWTGDGPVHVLGVAGSLLLVEEQRADGPDLLALDPAGRVAWRRSVPRGTLPDVAVRAGTVVLRTTASLQALSSRTGQHRWSVAVPAQPQYFPYGFQLDAEPMLDGTHLLLGTTTALVSLDLVTGHRTVYPLPVHGIDTTYWPYQVVTSGQLIAVVTNTGAVVLRRS